MRMEIHFADVLGRFSNPSKVLDEVLDSTDESFLGKKDLIKKTIDIPTGSVLLTLHCQNILPYAQLVSVHAVFF